MMRRSAVRTVNRRCGGVLIAALAAILPAQAQTSPHGNLDLACDRCHTSSAWSELSRPMRFNHAATSFALDGQHAKVSCRPCHASLVFGEAPTACRDCHDDVHRGELGQECDRCHSPETWLILDMPQRHAGTRFPLVGAHLSAACQACHPNQQQNEYVGTPTDCYACHSGDYRTTLTPAHAPAGIPTDCESCHAVTDLRWGGFFDHTRTAFPLRGAHLAVACVDCHQANTFRGTPTDCYGCHAEDFAATTNPSHVSGSLPTTCGDCHSTVAWEPASFDHNRTAFPLTGAHTATACLSCHQSGQYAGTPSLCASCHRDSYDQTASPAHAAAGFPLECQTCHSTSAWQPSSYNHDPLFPISSGTPHAPGRWSACSDCHTVPSNFKSFSCLTCHQHSQSSMDQKHSGVSRYLYESQACYQCHPRGRSGG